MLTYPKLSYTFCRMLMKNRYNILPNATLKQEVALYNDLLVEIMHNLHSLFLLNNLHLIYLDETK